MLRHLTVASAVLGLAVGSANADHHLGAMPPPGPEVILAPPPGFMPPPDMPPPAPTGDPEADKHMLVERFFRMIDADGSGALDLGEFHAWVRGVHLQPPHEGMMPPHEGMMPPHEGMMPPSGGMMPPPGGMMPPPGGMMPPPGGMMPPPEGMPPPPDGTMPPPGGMMPPPGGMMPPPEGMPPPPDGTMPPPEGMMPPHEGMMPPPEGMPPPPEGMMDGILRAGEGDLAGLHMAPECSDALRDGELLPQAENVPCGDRQGNLLFRTVCNMPGYGQVAISLPGGRAAGCFGLEALRGAIGFEIVTEDGMHVWDTTMGKESYRALKLDGPGIYQIRSTGGSPDGAVTVRFVDVPTGP